jgi:hypothetical protein
VHGSRGGPCSLGAFPLAILLRPPRCNKSFFILFFYQSIQRMFLKYDRELMGSPLLHTGFVLFIAAIWQFLTFCLPSIVSSSHVFHRICFCFHGILFLVSFSFFKVRVNFKRMVNPLLVPRPRLGKAPSSRDGKHTLTHITYRLQDSGRKLVIVIQFIANLTLVHPLVDARGI